VSALGQPVADPAWGLPPSAARGVRPRARRCPGSPGAIPAAGGQLLPGSPATESAPQQGGTGLGVPDSGVRPQGQWPRGAPTFPADGAPFGGILPGSAHGPRETWAGGASVTGGNEVLESHGGRLTQPGPGTGAGGSGTGGRLRDRRGRLSDGREALGTAREGQAGCGGQAPEGGHPVTALGAATR
jgi:hypothetical protein